MAGNDLTKAVNNLLTDLLSRQASQVHQSGPPIKEWATTTRRQTPLPQVSQRSAQLLQQIVDQGKKSKPGTSSGSSWASGPVMSRADMIAQRDPMYAMGPSGNEGGRGPSQQELPPPPVPQYESRPDLRIRGVEGRPDLQTRQYAAPPPVPQGLPAPTDSNGVPYPNWESLTPEQQATIYSSMGLSTPDQVQVQTDATRTPPTQEAPILGSIVDRKKAEILAADPYGEQFTPEPKPGTPGFGLQTGNAPLLTETIKAQQKADEEALLSKYSSKYNRNYSLEYYVNPDGTPTDAWLALSPDEQVQAMGGLNMDNPPTDIGGWQSRVWDGTKWVGKEVWGTDVIQNLMEIVDTVSGAEEVRRSTAGTAYYMATHNGERPPQTLTSGWMGSVADVIGSGGDLMQFIDENNPAANTDTSGIRNAASGVSMINYLDAHPELLPDIKRIYEYQLSLGASEQEAQDAVWSWFYAQQGIVTQLIAEGLWDPSWLIPIGGWAGRSRQLAAAKKVSKAGDTAAGASAAATDMLIGKILAGPQDILDAAGALPGKAIKSGWNKVPRLRELTEPADAVLRQTGQESVETAADIARAEGSVRGSAVEEETIRKTADEARVKSAKAEAERVAEQTRIDEAKYSDQQRRLAERDEAQRVKAETARAGQAAKIEKDRANAIADAQRKGRRAIENTPNPATKKKLLANLAGRVEDIEVKYTRSIEDFEIAHGLPAGTYRRGEPLPMGVPPTPTEQVIRDSENIITGARTDPDYGVTTSTSAQTPGVPPTQAIPSTGPTVQTGIAPPQAVDANLPAPPPGVAYMNTSDLIDRMDPEVVTFIRAYESDEVEKFSQAFANKGFDPNQPITLKITRDGQSGVAEGNHRLIAANDSGLGRVPVRTVRSTTADPWFKPVTGLAEDIERDISGRGILWGSDSDINAAPSLISPGVPPTGMVPSTGPVVQPGVPPLTAQSTSDEIFDGVMGRGDPLPQQVQEAIDGYDFDDIAKFDELVPEQVVPLNSRMIDATGDELYPDQVQRYIDDPKRVSDRADGPVEQHIIVVKDGDTYYIIEGKHRIAAGRISGETYLPMRVIDVTPAGAVDDIPVSVLPNNPDNMGYLAPGTLKSGEPNLAQIVVNKGADNPQAARAFMDEYEPMATSYIKRNPRGGTETPINVYDDVGNRVRSEEMFIRHFNEPSGYFDNKFMRTWDKATPDDRGDMAAIERAVFGSDEQSAKAFDQLVEASARPGSKVTGKMIDNLSQYRERFKGMSGRMTGELKPGPVSRNADTSISSSRTTATSPAQSTFDDIMAESKGMDEVPYTRVNKYDDADNLSRDIEQALHGGPGNASVKGSAAQARHRLYSSKDPEIRDMAAQLKTERTRLYGEETARSPESMGITINPQEQAKRWFRGTSNALEDAKARVLDHSIPGSAAVPPPASIDNWVDAAQKAGDITKGQRVHLETDTPITFTRNGEEVTEAWTFVNRLGDNLGRQRKGAIERAKKQVEFKSTGGKGHVADITDERVDEIIADLNKTWNDDYEKALNKTKKEFLATFTDPRKRNQAARAWNGFANYHRQNIQFNIVNGTSAMMQDWLSNGWVAFLHGEWGAARNVVKIQRKLWPDMPEGLVIEDILPQASLLKSQGLPIPKDYTGGGMARAQLESSGQIHGTEIWTEKFAQKNVIGNIFKPLAMPVIKKLRVTADQSWRIAVFTNAHARETIFGHANFMKRVYTKADELGDLTLADDIRALGLDGGFKPDQVRGVLREHGIKDDTLARQWAEELDTRYINAKKKTDKLYFTYKKTKIDDALSQVFMFHYFMTRSAPQHIQYLMQHPALALTYWNWWENKEAFANEAAPPWMKSWVQFAQAHGLYMMADFMSFFMGFTTFASFGEQGGYNDTLLEKWANKTGLFFAPQLRAALALAGLNKPGDPAAINKLNRAALAASDWIRNSDEPWVPDFLKDPGITDNFYQNIIDAVYRPTSKFANEKGLPFSKAYDPDSYTDKKRDEAEIVLVNTFEEMYGPRLDEDEKPLWTAGQEAEYVAALDDLNGGQYDNPYVQDAIRTVSEKDAANVGLDVISPVQSSVRIEESDQTYQDTQGAFERQRAGEDPLPGDENLMGYSDINSLGSPEARGLSSSYSQYQGIGTKRQQELNESWSLIAFGLDDPKNVRLIRDDWEITIDGQVYTAGQIRAMEDQERMDLADAWVAGVEIPGGKVAANVEDTGQGTGEFQQYRDQRGEMREANPTLDDFLTYRSWMYDFEQEPGGIRAKRLEMENGAPNSEFVQAVDEERSRLEKQGLSGEELEVRLDSWMTTEAGYAAMMGWQWKSNRSPGSALFDPLSYPWRASQQEPETPVDEPAVKAEPTPIETSPSSDQVSTARDNVHHWPTNYEWEDWKDRTRPPNSYGSVPRPTGLVEKYLNRR